MRRSPWISSPTCTYPRHRGGDGGAMGIIQIFQRQLARIQREEGVPAHAISHFLIGKEGFNACAMELFSSSDNPHGYYVLTFQGRPIFLVNRIKKGTMIVCWFDGHKKVSRVCQLSPDCPRKESVVECAV